MNEPVWTQRAEVDLQREFAFLEVRDDDKAYELLSVVDAGVRLICSMPGAQPFQRLVLRNPRYGLFYVTEPRGVVIHALCNLTQDRATILRHLDMEE